MTEKKPTAAKPVFYANCYQQLKEIALKYGYNLLVHGSMNRDFDLVALPWEQDLKSHLEMLDEFVEYLGGHIMPENDAYRRAFAETHHGRMRYVINLNRGGKETNYEDPQWYLDISIYIRHSALTN